MVTTIEQQVAASEARQLLQKSPIGELRDLQVDCDAERLQISGRVCSFYHKQLAQETVRSVAGSLRLLNAVNVD